MMVWAIAVANHMRRKGVGSEALDVALAVMNRVKQSNGLDCGVFARIHPRNDASRSLFKAHGFEYLGQYEDFETWVRDI